MHAAMFCVWEAVQWKAWRQCAYRSPSPAINCPQSLFVTIRHLWSPITRNSIALGQRVADITTGQGHDKLGVRAGEGVGREARISIHIHLLSLSVCVPAFVSSQQSVLLRHHNRHRLRPPPPEYMVHLRLWKRHPSRYNWRWFPRRQATTSQQSSTVSDDVVLNQRRNWKSKTVLADRVNRLNIFFSAGTSW